MQGFTITLFELQQFHFGSENCVRFYFHCSLNVSVSRFQPSLVRALSIFFVQPGDACIPMVPFINDHLVSSLSLGFWA